ncbi:MAG: alpha-L-fucosidase [Ginsengibacter sp.]
MKKILTACILLIFIKANAQQHNFSDNYIVPDDPLVQQKLAHWQDIKFGLLMHWGTYSEWGIVESWSICPEDEGWTQRRGPYAANYFDYVKAYENLQTTFNPTKFDPDKWAAAAKDAGMKYVVFTTKHHDGFCMFDTKQTDYKITSPKTPFSTNPKANIAKEVFDAFRKDGFMIGAYFSKPDWHCPYYWWPYFPPKDRNVNYDPKKYPDRWNDFKNYTYNQIQELMMGYGSMDILWLDGGWVRPKSTVDTSVEWQRGITYDQDIDMARIAKMARTNQPGLLVVDRTVSGKFENYVTPEQTIPSTPLEHPWESCITMGNSWSYVPNDHYKSSNELVHMLLKIVSRGGNFLLNIGPSPEGDWSDTAYNRLKEIGVWMKVHADGVYNTIPLAPYEDDHIVYLQSKDKKYRYVYVLSDKTNDVVLPASITISKIALTKKNTIVLMDTPKEKIKWKPSGDGIIIQVPSKLRNKVAGNYAIAFKITE